MVSQNWFMKTSHKCIKFCCCSSKSELLFLSIGGIIFGMCYQKGKIVACFHESISKKKKNKNIEILSCNYLYCNNNNISVFLTLWELMCQLWNMKYKICDLWEKNLIEWISGIIHIWGGNKFLFDVSW